MRTGYSSGYSPLSYLHAGKQAKWGCTLQRSGAKNNAVARDCGWLVPTDTISTCRGLGSSGKSCVRGRRQANAAAERLWSRTAVRFRVSGLAGGAPGLRALPTRRHPRYLSCRAAGSELGGREVTDFSRRGASMPTLSRGRGPLWEPHHTECALSGGCAV